MTRTEVLKRYGIVDRPKSTVGPTKLADGWRIGINGTNVDAGGAFRLSQELESIGELALAAHIVDAINTAKRNQVH